jgi:hypothetical protein
VDELKPGGEEHLERNGLLDAGKKIFIGKSLVPIRVSNRTRGGGGFSPDWRNQPGLKSLATAEFDPKPFSLSWCLQPELRPFTMHCILARYPR